MYRDICPRAQELCESRGGRPGRLSLINLVSVAVKQHSTNNCPPKDGTSLEGASLAWKNMGVKAVPVVTVTYFSFIDYQEMVTALISKRHICLAIIF